MNPDQNKNIPIDDEIDILPLINNFKREKKLIISISFVVSILTAISTLIEIPTWRGNFKIVISDSDENSLGIIKQQKSILDFLGIKKTDMDLKTQELILKSPSVLNPVYEYVKKEKNYKNDYLYEDWINGPLFFEIEKGSNVINVSYKDIDKDFIISVLKKISTEYKKYSTRDTEKGISNQISYLQKQLLILKSKSEESSKKLNKFRIENGFGDLGGIVSLNSQVQRNTKLDEKSNQVNNYKIENQRFKGQFNLLEKYEAEYLQYSSILKPESEYLSSLKSKIDNMKAFLRRPNELLIELKELERIAFRDDLLLNEFENNLSILLLRQAKEQKPWDIISEPTIEKNKISPKRKQKVLISFFIALLISLCIAYWKEKKSNIIYEESILIKKIKCKYIDKVYKGNHFINDNLISILKKENKFELISLSALMSNDISNLFEKNKVVFKNFARYIEANISSNFILIVEKGKILNSDVEILNKYVNAFPDKFKGWLLVE